jgi:hypothetical protein
MNTSLPVIFKARLLSLGMPLPVPEYRFGAITAGGAGKGVRERLRSSGLKDWRFDFAWPDQKVALEIEGGIFTGGRHIRSTGFIGDMAKYNAAAVLGWRLLRCQPKELTNTATIEMIGAALKQVA